MTWNLFRKERLLPTRPSCIQTRARFASLPSARSQVVEIAAPDKRRERDRDKHHAGSAYITFADAAAAHRAAAGLVGAMVAELPTGAQAGLGAKLLTGSYYGNTVGIWSALLMSALLGLALTGVVAAVERLSLRHYGNQGGKT